MNRRPRVAAPLSLAAALVIAAWPVGVRADDESDARALFIEGVGDLREDRFDEARGRLERSLELHPHGPTAFNLAVALQGLGRLRDASALVRSLRGGRFGALDETAAAAAAELFGEIQRDIATLAVRLAGHPQARIEVDGEDRGSIEDHGPPVLVEVDPGPHVVRAIAGDQGSDPVRVFVDAGGVAQLSLQIERGSAPGDAAAISPSPAQPTPETSRGVFEEPAFWIVAAVTVLLLGGGAVGLGIFLDSGSQGGLIVDDVFGVTITLTE